MLRHEPLIFLSPRSRKLRLVWHGDVGVLDKPAGISVHPTASYNVNSVAGMLREEELPCLPGNMLRFPHRLDAATSGVLMVAATREAAARIAAQLGPNGRS